MSSAVILCNGAFPTTEYPLYLLGAADILVCCDGAFGRYLDAGFSRLPDAVVGDMDSVEPELHEKYPSLFFPESEQDYNDLTKAMRFLLSHYSDIEAITILGATGLREDHTVGNLGLLMEFPRLFDLGDIRVEMVSDYGTAFAIFDTCELHVGEGRRVSLFSADNSLQIRSEGLHWPTDGVVFDAWWKATLN
nr:thiamine diphosphokinase [Bacteroidales bacterium]